MPPVQFSLGAVMLYVAGHMLAELPVPLINRLILHRLVHERLHFARGLRQLRSLALGKHQAGKAHLSARSRKAVPSNANIEHPEKAGDIVRATVATPKSAPMPFTVRRRVCGQCSVIALALNCQAPRS